MGSHLPRVSSDHAPLLLVALFRSGSKNRVFRFDNYWSEYRECHRLVSDSMNFLPHSTPLHAFSHLIPRTRSSLTNWRVVGANSLEFDIKATELKIQSLKSFEMKGNPNSDISRELRDLYNRHKGLLRQNVLKWAQRSRLMWVKNGDVNSKFFHDSARIHNHRNRISHIIDANGYAFTDKVQIEKCFLDSNLWTSEASFPYIIL